MLSAYFPNSLISRWSREDNFHDSSWRSIRDTHNKNDSHRNRPVNYINLIIALSAHNKVFGYTLSGLVMIGLGLRFGMKYFLEKRIVLHVAQLFGGSHASLDPSGSVSLFLINVQLMGSSCINEIREECCFNCVIYYDFI